MGDPIGTTADARAIRHQLAVFREPARTGWPTGPTSTRRASPSSGTTTARCTRRCSPAATATCTPPCSRRPDATWENWFLKFWLGFEGDQAAQYAATFAGLEPVDRDPRARRPDLPAVRGRRLLHPRRGTDAFAASDPGAKVSLYAAEHELDTDATTDRLAWLGQRAEPDRLTVVEHRLLP